MADTAPRGYVLLHPDGTITRHAGHAVDHPAVSCHGNGGQWLPTTKTGSGIDSQHLRLYACDCSTAMPEQHPANPLADSIVTALGHDQRAAMREFNGADQGWRGTIALARCGWDNEPIGLTDADLELFEQHRRRVAGAPGPAGEPAAADPPAPSSSDGYTPPPRPTDPFAPGALATGLGSILSVFTAGDTVSVAGATAIDLGDGLGTVGMTQLGDDGALPLIPLTMLIMSAITGTADDQITEHAEAVAEAIDERPGAWSEVALTAAQRMLALGGWPMGRTHAPDFLTAVRGADDVPHALDTFYVFVAEWIDLGREAAAAFLDAMAEDTRARLGRIGLWVLLSPVWFGDPEALLTAVGLTVADLDKGI